MGWFDSIKGSGIIVGDDALDAGHDFLRKLSELYAEGLDRKPTLAEVMNVLESGLKSSGSEFISDLEERAVTGLTVKTTAKRREQPHKVGDIFAVPLDEDLFAFGRIMYQTKTSGMLIEVFRGTSASKSFRPSIIDSGRLLGPIRMTGGRGCLRNWRWTVVASDDSYKIHDTDLSTEFSYANPVGGWCAVRFGSNDVRPVTDEEAKLLEDGGFLRPEQLEERIRQELRQQSR